VTHRAVLLVAAGCLVAGCGGPEESPADTSPPSSESSAATADAPSVAVEAGPVGVTADDEGSVWVVSAGAGALSRIPDGGSEPDLVVDLPGVPLRAVAAYDAVWTTSFDRGLLLAVDPGSGRIGRQVPTGKEPEGVAAGFGSVWVVTQAAGDLVRVDPRSGRVESRTDVGAGARLVAVGRDAVHVAQFEDDRVLSVDPGSGRVTRSGEVCDGPQGMAETGGLLWVACTPDDLVVGLDPATLRLREEVEVAGQPDSVAVDVDGSLLVVTSEGPTLARIDPDEAAVVGTLALSDELPLYDEANLDVALAGGQAWVTSYVADRVHHVPVTDVPGSQS